MEFLLAGVSACGAGVFTNPLEVVKTRMQLQGELKARGQYAVHYKNVFHAFYNIGKVDGIMALQAGLAPALLYQFCMNGFRLGAFQCLTNMGLTKDAEGKTSLPRSILAGATAGCIGAAIGSPIYMVKTQMQTLSKQHIAVGHQHGHTSMSQALAHIYKQYGISGLWRGVTATLARVMVGSAVQLGTFTSTREYIENTQFFPAQSVLTPLSASMLSGCVVVACMTPFDVVSTRIYNQPCNAEGKGLIYKNTSDCYAKIFRSEGIRGFYKGWGASLFRLGPHTVLSLVLWDRSRQLYLGWKDTS